MKIRPQTNDNKKPARKAAAKPEHKKSQVKTPFTWVLIADGKHAKIYKRVISEKHIPIGGDSGQTSYRETIVSELIPIENMEWKAEPETEYEKGRNKTGMVFESASPARSMSEPHLYISDVIRQKFVQSVAKKLNEASKTSSFSNLVLVAPVRTLSEFKKNLDEQVLAKIKIECPKDLTRHHGKELLKQLKNII